MGLRQKLAKFDKKEYIMGYIFGIAKPNFLAVGLAKLGIQKGDL